MKEMKVVQKRYLFGPDFTLSKLQINDKPMLMCPYILEDKVREIPDKNVRTWKVKNETAIPIGTYLVEKTFSNRFGKMMYQLMNVPGFEGIRIHSGNTSHDTEGCLITGRERDEKHGEVSGSRVARDALERVLDAAVARGEKIYWTIEGIKQ
jgi:hypothetical protein